MTNHSPAYILFLYLVEEGFITKSSQKKNWKGSYATMPPLSQESPGMVCLMDMGGNKDGRLMGSGETITHPAIQLRVRHADYNQAFKKISEIVNHLDTLHKQTVSIPN